MTDEIDLTQAVEETAAELTIEKKAEIKHQIRHVFDQIRVFEAQKRSSENDVVKYTEKLQKAQGKLSELRKGNWEILKQINLSQKDEPVKEGSNE